MNIDLMKTLSRQYAAGRFIDDSIPAHYYFAQGGTMENVLSDRLRTLRHQFEDSTFCKLLLLGIIIGATIGFRVYLRKENA